MSYADPITPNGLNRAENGLNIAWQILGGVLEWLACQKLSPDDVEEEIENYDDVEKVMGNDDDVEEGIGDDDDGDDEDGAGWAAGGGDRGRRHLKQEM